MFRFWIEQIAVLEAALFVLIPLGVVGIATSLWLITRKQKRDRT